MSKWRDRTKEAWYGILPLLILLGVPTVVGLVIWIIFHWDDIPAILNRITIIGNGSLTYGAIITLFSLIGLFNAFAAFMLWFKKFTEFLERKAKSIFWFWFIIIVVSFGWIALFEIIKML